MKQKILDKNGEVLIEIDSEKFPLQLPIEAPWGNSMRKLYLNWVYVEIDGEKKKIIKSLNVGK